MNLRAVAGRVLESVVVKGRSLTDVLADFSPKISDPRDRAVLQAICYGVCRWYFRLDEIAQKLLKTPFKQKDFDVYCLLLVGLYQLTDMRIPHHAAVGETVNAAKKLKKPWAKGLINGVLREYLRRVGDILPPACASHPQWMIEKVQNDYPTEWQNVLTANNQHPPFSLRVNQQKVSRENYLAKLAAAGIKAQIIPETKTGVTLESPIDVQQLPGFLAGEVSVQDGAAQLAAELLQLAPQQRVLDACAAPGGKTAHILETQPLVNCVAIDNDSTRLLSVIDNLKRLNLSANCVHADAGLPERWWDNQLFDRILLDAPCSASGVIRRHPDIKLLRRASDIVVLADTQLKLLRVLWPLLKPNGLLLYATCSIFSEENDQVIEQFLMTQHDAKEEKIVSSWGVERRVGKQILPGMQGMDGFYFAFLRKCSERDLKKI